MPVAICGLALANAARSGWSTGALTAAVALMAAALVFNVAITSRSYVSVTPTTLRYRQWWKEREVPLADILRPQYMSGFQGRRLHVPVRGQQAVELYARAWGAAPLEEVAVQLRVVASHAAGRR